MSIAISSGNEPINSLKDLRQAKELGAVGFTCNFWHQAFDWAREIGGITLLK